MIYDCVCVDVLYLPHYIMVISNMYNVAVPALSVLDIPRYVKTRASLGWSGWFIWEFNRKLRKTHINPIASAVNINESTELIVCVLLFSPLHAISILASPFLFLLPLSAFMVNQPPLNATSDMVMPVMAAHTVAEPTLALLFVEEMSMMTKNAIDATVRRAIPKVAKRYVRRLYNGSITVPEDAPPVVDNWP